MDIVMPWRQNGATKGSRGQKMGAIGLTFKK
jgi:hypothetical protein